jgi:hypothetical protein
VKTLF